MNNVRLGSFTNKLYALISIFFLIGLTSASISLTPSSFSFNAFPGETKNATLDIDTSGNFTVYLSSESNGNITINYNSSSPIIVERHKQIIVSFYFPTGIANGTYDIYLKATTEAEDMPQYIFVNTETIRTVSSGGGGSYVCVYPNGSKSYGYPCHFSEYKQPVLLSNNSVPENNSINLNPPIIPDIKKSIWFWVMFLFAIILAAFVIYTLEKAINSGKKR